MLHVRRGEGDDVGTQVGLADARRDRDSEEIDRLVRSLVSRGADVKQAVKGNVFYTALSAACFGVGTGTINFLLDEGASADLADPVFGRLPLHFAAMNGIENFRAILLAYRGDMMRPDNSGMTCLHWAAQFGNAETVGFILSKAGDSATRKRYVSAPDEHQWTPLCWAVRGLKLSLAEGMVSETPDHAAIVRIFLENGADPLIECPLGNGDTAESLTLLELARRSDASDEVISTLARHLEGLRPDGANWPAQADGALVRRYTAADTCCDDILGYSYKCTSCPGFDVCTTCLPTVAKYHNAEIWDDNLPHTFERDPKAEYQDLPVEQDGPDNRGAMPRSPSPEGSEQSDPCNKSDEEDFELNDLEVDLALEDD
ncbi:ankyrin repeat-containing domain protein [Parachaetomium inaequale]|uniref:Ankyrin repeat-containing domain protein n=1 Tax=Parachaetomium inaequale TaxID=2588326 RepID=A0AAN6STQ2_9PEZI|nr:ankyrin repeat-containing domain protein [Parachaetomium inaequale]